MTAFSLDLLVVVVYRLALVAIGLALAYMSYRLFRSGFFEAAGELKAAWGDRNLPSKQAAPGILFAILAAVMITWSMLSNPPSVPSGTSGVALARSLPDSIVDIVLKSVCQARLSPGERQRLATWYAAHGRGSCP